MTDVFAPPLKTLPAPKLDLASVDPAPPEVEAVPSAAATGTPQPTGLDEEGGTSADNAVALDSAVSTLPMGAEAALGNQSLTIAAVDTVFFYGRLAAGPLTLYEVNLEEGSLTSVNPPEALFSTAISALFTAQSGGLGGSGEVVDQPPSSPFTLIEGSSGKNFLIGTVADNALFGFGGGDLILTGQGRNLSFGGAGNDTLVGGTGDDGLFGGAGNDAIEGDGGDDLLVGGSGNDILYGGAGTNM
ncbi:MAG: hypothetical protein WBA99_04985, partial [Nodosilinea sp.]